jgi:hypothetical protein
MRQRGFSETDLRRMLFAFHGIRPTDDPARWAVDAALDSRPWRDILEPDLGSRVVVVITAYPLEQRP